MQLDSIKATVTAIWVAAACAAGIAGNLRSLSDWAALAGLAVLPTLVMMWRQWNDPHQTKVETIQVVLR